MEACDRQTGNLLAVLLPVFTIPQLCPLQLLLPPSVTRHTTGMLFFSTTRGPKGAMVPILSERQQYTQAVRHGCKCLIRPTDLFTLAPTLPCPLYLPIPCTCSGHGPSKSCTSKTRSFSSPEHKANARGPADLYATGAMTGNVDERTDGLR